MNKVREFRIFLYISVLQVIIQVYNYNTKDEEIDHFEIILQSSKDSVQQTLTGNKKAANLILMHSFSENDCRMVTLLNFSSSAGKQ